MWAAIERVIKPNGAIVLFGSQPFTSALVMSKAGWFKYAWVWEKNRPTGAQQSKNMPMRIHEDVTVFSLAPMGHTSQLGDRRMRFAPIGTRRAAQKTVMARGFHGRTIGARPNQVGNTYNSITGAPMSILRFPKEEAHIHPTQKPVALLAYLIRTYTNKGETVLDFCMGSGSTGAACIEEGRDFIGIEKDEGCFEIASERLEHERTKPRTLRMEMTPNLPY
jgi:site-specific DNA-methyltransferase (adenine-specific)